MDERFDRPPARTLPARPVALPWAETQAGEVVLLGRDLGRRATTVPGLVMALTCTLASASMLADWRLVRVSTPERGDLAFYGTGHVELVTRTGTFGALQTGTRIGWHQPSGWWRPRSFPRQVGFRNRVLEYMF
jgi:hypothetical protein